MAKFTITAALAASLLPAVSASMQCDAVCQQVLDPKVIGSIGSTIETSVAAGNADIVRGVRRTEGWYETSAIWNIWASALDLAFPSRISHITASGHPDDVVCVDKTLLAKLTAAVSSCHHQVSTLHVNSSSIHMQTPGLEMDLGGAGQLGGILGADSSTESTGSILDSASGSSGHVSSDSNTGNVVDTHTSSSTGSTTHTTTGWGHGNVNADICFKIKDKRSDRYLTSGGTEYAFAYYPNYYSIFRAHASKSVENGYTLIEINRSGSTVNYPVKQESLGQFKPLYGSKDAVFTFTPATFGDSCWGVPGKKMSRRHDWGGWGDNYRIGSSGEDCAEVELEEADC